MRGQTKGWWGENVQQPFLIAETCTSDTILRQCSSTGHCLPVRLWFLIILDRLSSKTGMGSCLRNYGIHEGLSLRLARHCDPHAAATLSLVAPCTYYESCSLPQIYCVDTSLTCCNDRCCGFGQVDRDFTGTKRPVLFWREIFWHEHVPLCDRIFPVFYISDKVLVANTKLQHRTEYTSLCRFGASPAMK